MSYGEMSRRSGEAAQADNHSDISPSLESTNCYALFVKGGKLAFVYNFLGIPPEQRLTTDAPKLGKHIVGVEFNKESLSTPEVGLNSATRRL